MTNPNELTSTRSSRSEEPGNLKRQRNIVTVKDLDDCFDDSDALRIFISEGCFSVESLLKRCVVFESVCGVWKYFVVF